MASTLELALHTRKFYETLLTIFTCFFAKLPYYTRLIITQTVNAHCVKLRLYEYNRRKQVDKHNFYILKISVMISVLFYGKILERMWDHLKIDNSDCSSVMSIQVRFHKTESTSDDAETKMSVSKMCRDYYDYTYIYALLCIFVSCKHNWI